MNKDFRQELTDKIVKSMEEATDKNWEMPWKKIPTGISENPLSGTKYTGANRLMLTIEASEKGIPNRWVTFKQAAKEGLKVKSGERGIALEKWGMYDFWQTKEGKNLKLDNIPVKDIMHVSDIKIQFNNGKKANKDDAMFMDEKGNKYSFRDAVEKFSIPYIKTFTVFNVNQIENAPKEWLENPLKDLKEPEKIKKAEDIIKAMEKDGVKFEYGGNKAAYHLITDTVNLPDRRQFVNEESLYGTTLHEIAHSTGHPKRLNREFGCFGDEKYSKEELRAEIASYFLSTETGINFNTGNTALYLNSWIKALKNDKNELFKAAKDASNAVDYIQGRVNELENSKEKDFGGGMDNKLPGAGDAFSQDLQRRLNKSKNLGIGG